MIEPFVTSYGLDTNYLISFEPVLVNDLFRWRMHLRSDELFKLQEIITPVNAHTFYLTCKPIKALKLLHVFLIVVVFQSSKLYKTPFNGKFKALPLRKIRINSKH